MAYLIREAPVGRLIRLLSGDRYLRYPEEEPNFVLPGTYQALFEKPLTSPTSNSVVTIPASNTVDGSTASNTPTAALESQSPEIPSLNDAIEKPEGSTASDPEPQLDKRMGDSIAPRQTPDGIILVGWYDHMDSANPQNWTRSKKAGASLILFLYTVAVYTGSAIYVSSEPSIGFVFGVSGQVAALPLSLYVLACKFDHHLSLSAIGN